jgi:hypothetical protein
MRILNRFFIVLAVLTLGVHAAFRPAVSIEGQGTYLGRGEGAGAFTVGGNLRFNLLPVSEGLVPHIAH